MYILTVMCWSDASMGDGNPQTQVLLRETLDEIKQAVMELAIEEFGANADGDPEPWTYEEALDFLKDAPESPELDISEITIGGDWVTLTRDVLDDAPRTFNGKREI